MITINKKDLEILFSILEMEELEPENNHLHYCIVRPVEEILCNIDEDLNVVGGYTYIEDLYYEIKSNTNYCRKSTYNKRIVKLRDLIIKLYEGLKRECIL